MYSIIYFNGLSVIRSLRLFFVILATSLGVGCNDGLVDFQAKVLLDGTPLEGAAVSLVGIGESRGRPCSGVSDGEGKVSFTTFTPNDGVLPGSYKVVVIKSPQSIAEQIGTLDRNNPDDLEKIVALEHSGSNVNFTPSLLPRHYLSPDTTPLSCEVSEEKTEAVFELDGSIGKK